MVRFVKSYRRRHDAQYSFYQCVLFHAWSCDFQALSALWHAKNAHVALLEKQWHTRVRAKDVRVVWKVRETEPRGVYCIVTVLIRHGACFLKEE